MFAVWEAAALMPASVVAAFQIITGLPVSKRLAAHVQQAARIGRAFEVGEDRASAGVVEKGGEQLRRIDVGLVAGGYAVAEAQALRLGEVDDRISEAAGLKRARHRARAEVRLVGDAAERGPHPRLQRQHALAVGADDAHAGLGNRALQLVLELAALGTGLPEAGGQHHRKRDLRLAAVADRLRDGRCRHRDDGEVARLPDRRRIRIALEAVQLGILGVDREDAALEAGTLQRLDRVPADAGEVGGRTDDGDAARVEQALEAHVDSP